MLAKFFKTKPFVFYLLIQKPQKKPSHLKKIHWKIYLKQLRKENQIKNR